MKMTSFSHKSLQTSVSTSNPRACDVISHLSPSKLNTFRGQSREANDALLLPAAGSHMPMA